MKNLAILSFTFSLLLSGSAVHALPSCTLSSKQAQALNGDPVKQYKVWAGYPLSISLLETNEIIKEAFLGDPSWLVVSSLAGELCPQFGDAQNNCTDTGAKVILIRRIKPIVGLPLLSSTDGGTELNLVVQDMTVEGTKNLKQYRIKLLPAKGVPSGCTNISIKSEENSNFTRIKPRF